MLLLALFVANFYSKDTRVENASLLKQAQSNLSDTNETARRHKWFNSIIKPAQKSQSQYKILTSITLAQAILESDFGKSDLSAKYNNLFGIKDKKGVDLPTTEFYDGKKHTVTQTFATYKNKEQSILKHSELLVKGTTDKPDRYKDLIGQLDYKKAAQVLQDAGYATDPDYASKLISVIEKYDLTQYDL